MHTPHAHTNTFIRSYMMEHFPLLPQPIDGSIHTHTHTHTRTYMYTHRYIHTHIHTHTHIRAGGAMPSHASLLMDAWTVALMSEGYICICYMYVYTICMYAINGCTDGRPT